MRPVASSTKEVGSDGIVDGEFPDEFLDGVPVVIIHDETDDLEVVPVFVLELHEVRDFGATGSAPSGPEIQQNDFILVARKRNGLAVEAGQIEIGGGIGVANKADGGLLAGLLGGCKQGKEAENYGREDIR